MAQQAAIVTVVGGGTQTPPTTSVATVVSYTAVVDVANPDLRLRPGMTAQVTVTGATREHVTRIPNSALSFRPPPDVLQALGQHEPVLSNASDRGAREGSAYDGKLFTPMIVHAGLADGGWTELLSGNLRAGDELVTTASISSRH